MQLKVTNFSSYPNFLFSTACFGLNDHTMSSVVRYLHSKWIANPYHKVFEFFYGKVNENHHPGTGFFLHKRIASAVKRVEFVSDRMSYIVLRGHWCNIIILNVHAPSEEKSDSSKDSFYEELEEVFNHFPKYDMKNLLGDFNAKVGRENIFKPTVGNESLYEDSNDNSVRIVNFVTAKYLIVKSRMFPHRYIHKHN